MGVCHRIRRKFKKSGKQFASETTIHGVAEFARSDWVGKFAWVFIFIGSLFFFVYQSYTLTVKFTRHESVTSIDSVPAVFPNFALYADLTEVYDYDFIQNELPLRDPKISEDEVSAFLNYFVGTASSDEYDYNNYYNPWRRVPFDTATNITHTRLTYLIKLFGQKPSDTFIVIKKTQIQRDDGRACRTAPAELKS